MKERIETLGIRAGYVVLKSGESIGKHSTKSKEEKVIKGRLNTILSLMKDEKEKFLGLIYVGKFLEIKV